MKLGINLLLWSDDVTDERFLPLFEMLAHIGYDGVEVPIMQPAPERYARLGRRLDDLGLARTAVNVRSAAHDPISADAAVRAAGQQQMVGILESCQALGASLLAGPTYAALGVFSGRGPTEEQWSTGVDSVRRMAEAAAGCRVTLALEPLNRFEIYLLNTAKEGARFVEAVDHPRCRLMYDTFHAHIEETSIPAALAAARSTLIHVHISENHRGTPGRGLVDWDATFMTLQTIGYEGWLTVEAFGLALPRLAAATKVWRPLFDSEENLAKESHSFLRDRLAGWGEVTTARHRPPASPAHPIP